MIIIFSIIKLMKLFIKINYLNVAAAYGKGAFARSAQQGVSKVTFSKKKNAGIPIRKRQFEKLKYLTRFVKLMRKVAISPRPHIGRSSKRLGDPHFYIDLVLSAHAVHGRFCVQCVRDVSFRKL